MKVLASILGRRLLLSISGELDHHGARAAMSAISARIDVALPAECVLDMSGVTFMDSSGIAVILKTQRRMAELSGSFSVENVPPQAMRVLDAAGIGRIVSITASAKQ